MLTKIRLKNFKVCEDVEIDLDHRVLFIGPNNSGKTSVLQALALWSVGVRSWVEKRGTDPVGRKRSGVVINRRDLVYVPVPTARLLWHNQRVREGYKHDGKQRTRNILMEIEVQGVSEDQEWSACLEFDYANQETLYCRPKLDDQGRRSAIPQQAADVRIAYLPPMSGLAATETRLDEGALQVRIGEGRTAEVLRNLCWQVHQGDPNQWQAIVARMEALFGTRIEVPKYIPQRGEIDMTFRTADNVELDLSASGRGQQQTLLLLAYMMANPGSVLLLDEPDAHLEILRQREIYQDLSDMADESDSQLIAASHSEVLLNEAAERDLVVAFVGQPHPLNDRGSQLAKALREIDWKDYYQAEQAGWVLYLEGATDLAILRALAHRIGHPAAGVLDRPFVCYVQNQPKKAERHFFGLCEAKSDLLGVALYDRLDRPPPSSERLKHLSWNRNEIENYICQEHALIGWAEHVENRYGPLFGWRVRDTMREAIQEVVQSLQTLGRPSPWGPDLKVSEDFLGPLFELFYKKLGMKNRMWKKRYYELAQFVDPEALDPEVTEKLDAIAEVARQAGQG